MIYHILEGDISSDNESLKKLLSILSDTEDSISLGIDSDGGILATGMYLLDILNSFSDRLELYIVGTASSCALTLWIGYTGYKDVYPGAVAVAHMSSRSITLSETGVTEGGKVHIKDTGHLKTLSEKYEIPILTPRQRTQFWQDTDVILTYSQLKKIANKHNKINKRTRT